jgi:hypothetical protein
MWMLHDNRIDVEPDDLPDAALKVAKRFAKRSASVIEAGPPSSSQIDHDHIRAHKGVDMCVERYVLIIPSKSACRRLWSPPVNHRHVTQLLPHCLSPEISNCHVRKMRVEIVMVR